jgi:hypothetical protein
VSACPWGPPDGLGVEIDERCGVVRVDSPAWTYDEFDRRRRLTPLKVRRIYTSNLRSLVPPTPGGDS